MYKLPTLTCGIIDVTSNSITNEMLLSFRQQVHSHSKQKNGQPAHLDDGLESPTARTEILEEPPTPREYLGETTTNWRELGDVRIGNTEIVCVLPEGNKSEDRSRYMDVVKNSAANPTSETADE